MVALRLPTPEDVRRLRKRAGLTQKELAERAGVSQSLIARIETGTVDPRLSTFKKIMKAISAVEERRTTRDVMHSPVITISATDSVRKAVELMKNHDISQMPVLSGKRIVGSIRESTIIKRIAERREPEEIFAEPVQSVMEEELAVVSPSTSVEDVIALLFREQPATLVVDHGKLIGIVTKMDVISSMTRMERL